MFIKIIYIFLALSLLVPPVSYAKEPGGIAGIIATPDKEKQAAPKVFITQSKTQEEPVIHPKILYTAEELGDDIIGPVDEREKSFVAVEKPQEDRLACVPTPSVQPVQRIVKPIRKGNNLTQKVGYSGRASGNYVNISGLVMDENCVPIQGAVIEIWQADRLGRYEQEYDKQNYFSLPLQGKDKNFLFSGTAQTDNMGQYNFVTIFPGSKEESAPYINITVKREGYNTLHTRMYFAEHPRNETDPVLSSVEGEGRNALIAAGRDDESNKNLDRIFFFPITISGVGPYKRY